jgi:hypothetical protein
MVSLTVVRNVSVQLANHNQDGFRISMLSSIPRGQQKPSAGGMFAPILAHMRRHVKKGAAPCGTAPYDMRQGRADQSLM